jgi:hypothetical protein
MIRAEKPWRAQNNIHVSIFATHRRWMGQTLPTVQTLECPISSIADIRAQNVALALRRSVRPPRLAVSLRDLTRDRLFALLQLALLALPGALLVAGLICKPLRRCGLGRRIGFRQLRTCRYAGPGRQWVQKQTFAAGQKFSWLAKFF